MKANIVTIGNSKGNPHPQVLFKLCGIEDKVNLDVKGDSIVINPVKHKPREGWDTAFKAMHENQDDRLLIDDSLDLDTESGKW